MPDEIKNQNTVVKEVKKEEKIDTANDLKAAVKGEVKPDAKIEEKLVEKKEEVVEASEEEKKSKVKKRIDAILHKEKPAVKVEPRVESKPDADEDAEVKKLISEGKTYEAIKLVEKRAGDRIIRESRETVKQDLTLEEQKKNFLSIREKANRSVWERHPEVLDVDEGIKKPEEVPMAMALQQVYKEKPYLMEVADGPEVAMELAERRLGLSDSTRKAKEEGRKEEVERTTRTTASSAISSSASAGGSSAQVKKSRDLDDNEKRVARKLGLTEEEYLSHSGNKTVNGPDYYNRNRVVKRKV